MPRLSVIIPHRRTETDLENTVLSVLENRPADSEIIVVDDGSYSNPYQLDDEVLFLDSDPGASVMEMINAGVLAACAPVVNTILDGVIVSTSWADSPLEILERDRQTAAVAVGIEQPRKRASFGIDHQAMRDPRRIRRQWLTQSSPSEHCAAPQIACGFFRKSLLLALDGFQSNDVSSAELEIAYALEQLELNSRCHPSTLVAGCEAPPLRGKAVQELAQLAVEHQTMAGGWLSALKRFPGALVQDPTTAIAWCLGIANGQQSASFDRLDTARLEIAVREEQHRPLSYLSNARRRAA